MRPVNTPAEIRKLILSTSVSQVVGQRVYWPRRPQNVDINTVLPCITIYRAGGTSDFSNNPLGLEIWYVKIEGNDYPTCLEIDNILRTEFNGHPSPYAVSPGILAVNVASGAIDSEDEVTLKPAIISAYAVRVAFEI